jgi:hypothetical protein
VQAPRFRDRISDHGDIEVAWTVPAIFLSYTLSDAGSPLAPSSSPALVATGPIPFDSTDRIVDKSLFSLANGTRLIPGHLYRIAFTLTGSTGLIVKTSIDVVLKD